MSLLAAVAFAAAYAVRVPGLVGEVPAQCVHEVPVGCHVRLPAERGGDTIIEVGGVEVARHAACLRRAEAARTTRSPPHPFEWKAWTEYNAPSGLKSLSGSWVVPAAPTKPTLYNLFYFGQGAMPASNGIIIQSMLQWGLGAPSGGAQSWAVASWVVGDGSGYFTRLLDVAPGNTVRSELTQLTANGTWLVNSVARGESVNVTTSTGADPLTWAYNVAESFSLGACDQYPPNTLVFSDLALEMESGRSAGGEGAGGGGVVWSPQAESQYPLLCKGEFIYRYILCEFC